MKEAENMENPECGYEGVDEMAAALNVPGQATVDGTGNPIMPTYVTEWRIQGRSGKSYSLTDLARGYIAALEEHGKRAIADMERFTLRIEKAVADSVEIIRRLEAMMK